MQALIYTAPNRVESQEAPAPRPAPGSQRLRVDAGGICGSDLRAFKGPRRAPPMVRGHAFVGTALDGARDGHCFAANPILACGRCRCGHQGLTNLGSQRSMIGMNLPGAFAQELPVPDGRLVPVPTTPSDAAAVISEPAATDVHALAPAERASARPLAARRAPVPGAGAIGLLAVLLPRSRGVAASSVVESSPRRAATRDIAIAAAAPGSVVAGRGAAAKAVLRAGT
jgi:threonine dehydrogenase-like Zn-dependent dehydrogenase